MRRRITAALLDRPGGRLDAFTADLLTGCAAVTPTSASAKIRTK
ncbi:hypothetical protein [Actinomadura spongiicola]|nr:hypothetical protein [Actinomadura spongiicola]